MFRFVFRFLSLFCGGPPPESVVEVMDKHGDRILRVAYSYLHNMEDAEDILQDTLIKYMQSSPDFSGPEHEKAWLITVASNLSKNKIKYNKVREADELSEELVGREEQDLAFVTLHKLPDVPGIVASLFGFLSESGILVDMIVQSAGQEGIADVTFTVSQKYLDKTLEAVKQEAGKYDGVEVSYDAGIGKIAAMGVGLRNHAGVAARIFQALTDAGVNMLMISTSEIKLTIFIKQELLPQAVEALHKALGLVETDQA